MISATVHLQEEAISSMPFIVIEATGRDILEEHDPVVVGFPWGGYTNIFATRFVGDPGFNIMVQIGDVHMLSRPTDPHAAWRGLMPNEHVYVDGARKIWSKCYFPFINNEIDKLRLDITAGDGLSCDAKFDLRFAIAFYDPRRCS